MITMGTKISPEINGVVGGERVYNKNSGEISSFLIIGGSFDVGAISDPLKAVQEYMENPDIKYPFSPSASVSLYHAGIYNLERNSEYAGWFEFLTVTVAHIFGVTGGEAYVPDDTKRADPHSTNVGVVIGEGVSVNGGRAYYIPTWTYNTKTGEWSFFKN